MRMGGAMLAAVVLSGFLFCGCGGGSPGGGVATPVGPTPAPAAVTPTVTSSTSNGAQNGASIVSLSSTTSGATIYYTLDGSAPTTSSQIYAAPILVSSTITVKAMAVASGYTNSAVASQAFTQSISSGTLV